MKNLLSITVCIVFIFIILGALPIHGEEEVYDSVLRLHVLANSDSEEDQALKLVVRDAILKESAPLLENAETREDAARIISENVDILTETAKRTVEQEGYDYDVTITLLEEEYPTKNYEALSFPSGSYLSLKVCIGDAEGQNWWCVLFPPLCLSAATEKQEAEDAFIAVGLTDDQYKIITETEDSKYTVRFKLLETIEEAKTSISGRFGK